MEPGTRDWQDAGKEGNWDWEVRLGGEVGGTVLGIDIR